MGKYKHDTLWLVFHKISHSALRAKLSPQHVGKSGWPPLICGGLDQSRGEQLIYRLGMDLSFNGLGDGDHSSEPSLLSRGFLIVKEQRFHCHQPGWFMANTSYKTENNYCAITRKQASN